MSHHLVVLLFLFSLGCGVKAPPSYEKTKNIVPWEEPYLKKKKEAQR